MRQPSNATPPRQHWSVFEPAFGRVQHPRLQTARLQLRPACAGGRAALPGDRDAATSELRAAHSPEWPHADLLDVLPMQAAAESSAALDGLWVIIERATKMVIGDIGFRGPPDADASSRSATASSPLG